MSSVLIVQAHDEHGRPVEKRFQIHELNLALAEFLIAINECEAATLRWSA